MNSTLPRGLALFGAGGFGREIAWSMMSADGRGPLVRCLVDDRPDESFDAMTSGANGLPVLSPDAFVQAFPGMPLVVAIGAPAVRRAVVERLEVAGHGFATLVHDRVRLAPSVRIGAGTIVCDGVLTTVGIVLGRHVHVNLGCTIGHDSSIGDFATLSPGVHVSGHVRIENSVFVGTGAVIINGEAGRPLTLGAGSIIGAGACVTGDTEPDTLYVGVPARPVRRRVD